MWWNIQVLANATSIIIGLTNLFFDELKSEMVILMKYWSLIIIILFYYLVIFYFYLLLSRYYYFFSMNWNHKSQLWWNIQVLTNATSIRIGLTNLFFDELKSEMVILMKYWSLNASDVRTGVLATPQVRINWVKCGDGDLQDISKADCTITFDRAQRALSRLKSSLRSTAMYTWHDIEQVFDPIATVSHVEQRWGLVIDTVSTAGSTGHVLCNASLLCDTSSVVFPSAAGR